MPESERKKIMPRERVHHGSIFVETEPDPSLPDSSEPARRPWHPGEPVPEGKKLFEQPSLDVSWNKDAEWVQIAFSAPRDWWENFFASHKDDTMALSYSAFTDVMSRQELNHMIRTLRRARDTAYGSDE